jgi:hypothetical protein
MNYDKLLKIAAEFENLTGIDNTWFKIIELMPNDRQAYATLKAMISTVASSDLEKSQLYFALFSKMAGNGYLSSSLTQLRHLQKQFALSNEQIEKLRHLSDSGYGGQAKYNRVNERRNSNLERRNEDVDRFRQIIDESIKETDE